MISIITPTGDRPEAMRLCSKWMLRQDYDGEVQWIIVDDGAEPYTPECPEAWEGLYLRAEPLGPSVESFARNLLTAAARVQGDLVVIVEDDDWYAPTHLSELSRRLESVCAAGEVQQRYYHLPTRSWRRFRNRGSSLCQTGFQTILLPEFEEAAKHARETGNRGVDAMFWRSAERHYPVDIYADPSTVVGIKGMPGRNGLGIGHRPGAGWTLDADLSHLRSWVGEDAMIYEPWCEVANEARR